MAWTAELTSVTRKGSMTVPLVRFVSDEPGVPPFEEQFHGDDITPEKLAIHCKRRIAQLDFRDAAFKRFVVGPVDVSKVDLKVL